MKVVASNQGMTLSEYMWNTLEKQTNFLASKNHSISSFMDKVKQPEPPNNLFDMRGWKEYVKSLDCYKWKKCDKLFGDLIDLSNMRRSELKKLGKL